MWNNVFRKREKPVRFIVLIYILLGGLWILFSDKAILFLFDDPALLTQMQTFKGWFYVFGSGLLIYVLLSRLVSELNSTEQNLRRTETLQQEFFDKHYQPLWIADMQGNCLFSNAKWYEFTGHAIASSLPFSWLDRVHPHDKPYCIDKFTQGFIDKKAFELEYRLLTRQDEYHWVQNTCLPRHDTSGNYQGFTCFLFDIEEKKHLQEQYKDSSRRYGYLFANNPNPMFVYDTQDLRILEANKAAFALYGYDEKEFLTLSIIDLRPASEIPLLMDHLSEALPDFHRSSGWIHQRKDGSLFDVEVSGHTLPVQNNRSMRLVIIRDITEQIKAFRSAKEGDRRFKAIFDHSPQGAVICSDDLKILDINPSGCDILDITRDNVLKISLPSVMDIHSDPMTMSLIQKLQQGKPAEGEANFFRSGGIEFRAAFNGISFIENGITKIYISFNDIDKNHKMQIALQESERLNATLVSNLPGMVYRCENDEAWTMTFVSFGVENLTGYKTHEILHNATVSYESIIHAEDRDAVRKTVERGLKEERNFDIQYRIVTKEGAVKWVWEQARGIFYSNDKLKYIEGFIMDVTNEKAALQKVEFQSHFLGLIIDNIPFPLFYKNMDGIYEGCNKSFCDFLGLKKNDIVGHSVFDIFEKEQAESFYEKDRILMEEKGVQIYETEISFPDGRKMDALFHKSTFQTLDNAYTGIIGVYFDITQRVEAENVIKQQLEELGRINSELERFSYTVSHDLRSPLVTIKGFLGLLKEDMEEKNEEQVQEDITRIENATDKMQQLLEDLLKLSRIGKTLEQNEEFSMTVAASEAHELLFGLFKGKKCEVSIQPDMPVVVAGKARIRELFQNLMENSIKFSLHQQSPMIKIFSKKQDGEHVFCVQDNGIGIPEAYHEKVFGLFNKLDNNSSGTGLGLSLVKKIVENYNGRIWIESTGKDSGTIINFTLNTEKPRPGK